MLLLRTRLSKTGMRYEPPIACLHVHAMPKVTIAYSTLQVLYDRSMK